MKVLMSAFSCGPGRGSEPGVGWNMALETARLGHEVVVLTQTEYQESIVRELAAGKVPGNLRFDIFTPGWLERLRDAGLKCGLPSLIWPLVSLLWQFCALFHARRHYKQAGFDLVHHVTFAAIRQPTLLTRLGLPTVIGPLGGGDRVPFALRKSFPWGAWTKELVRDIYNVALRADPITRSAFRDATLILLRTEASLVAVPPRCRNKVHINVGTGIAQMAETKVLPRTFGEPFRLLYAGNLLYLKGIHLGLRALAHARAHGANVTLTIAGGGPARRDLEKLARQLDIAAHVIWCGELPRQKLLGIYSDHDAFLFPSLRDAGPTVVMEAWAHGLPVICLALGGLARMVDESCGRIVAVAKRSEGECVAGLAAEIVALAENEGLRLSLAQGAIARYRECLWPKTVAALYAEIESRLQRGAGGVVVGSPRYLSGRTTNTVQEAS
jgi:glycosyltransferase involved in cell wall biosynthesis